VADAMIEAGFYPQQYIVNLLMCDMACLHRLPAMSLFAVLDFMFWETDTVGELKSAEMGVSNMPSWKAKKLEKLAQEDVLLEL
jgi:hypothetical protein